jgi:hypothetical protein
MSNPFFFFANPAKPEEQGGFCDTTSKIHYCNETEEEMHNRSAVHAEHTGNSADVRGGEATRYNTTILEVDPLGSEHPATYAPGR